LVREVGAPERHIYTSRSPGTGVALATCTNPDDELSGLFRGLGHPRALARVRVRHDELVATAIIRMSSRGVAGAAIDRRVVTEPPRCFP
jgi:hypothetical protein